MGKETEQGILVNLQKKKYLEPDKYFCFREETIYQQQNKPESVQSHLLKTKRTIQSLAINSKHSQQEPLKSEIFD